MILLSCYQNLSVPPQMIHHVSNRMSKNFKSLRLGSVLSLKGLLILTFYLFIHHNIFSLNSSLCYSTLPSVQNGSLVPELHLQIPGRKGMQPPHDIPFQYIIYRIKFKRMLINLLIYHNTNQCLHGNNY